MSKYINIETYTNNFEWNCSTPFLLEIRWANLLNSSPYEKPKSFSPYIPVRVKFW